jgi:signal transduction histidine kinase
MLKDNSSRFSLKFSLISKVIIPLVLSMALITYFGLHAMENIIEKRMQTDVQLIARALRMQISYSLEKERFNSINQALQTVFSIERIYGAYVYDNKGKRLLAVGSAKPSNRSESAKVITDKGERKGKYEEIEGKQVYSYFVPLFDSRGSSNGLLQVTRKKSDIVNFIDKVRTLTTISLSLVGLFFAGLILFGFHGAVGKYLNQLIDSISRISAGDRKHRASLKAPKEISSVAQALNSMLDNIVSAEKEIATRKDAQKELEQKLRQSEKMAAIGQLAAGMAHELGTPLSVINGQAQRGLRDQGLDEKHKKKFHDIREEVQRMEQIVRQLLDFGRSSKHKRRRTQAAYLAKSAASLVQKEMSFQRQIELTLDGPDPGPTIFVDPMRIEQALVNLLRNAFQAENVSNVSLSWAKQDEKMISFKVEDDGSGISDNIKDKLFEPFFSTKKTGQGSGLGLSVVHGVVQEHDGEVYVSDSVLGGTCLEIVLPIQQLK